MLEPAKKFGIYFHIPYCQQICPYCDFVKFKLDPVSKSPVSVQPEDYCQWLAGEIQQRHSFVPWKSVTSIYFGGGTPSAIDPALILALLNQLANVGFQRSADCELTIEIDPANVSHSRLLAYKEFGFNRFSLGVQSFNDRLLKIAGRQHTGRQAQAAIELLHELMLPFSFDLLFALPTQSLAELELDVKTALALKIDHLSCYCLNVPDQHPMQKNRAPEPEQIKMFERIESLLKQDGLLRYEVSNFCRPGKESKHNLLHWTGEPYWGLGMGAHSYFTNSGFGRRFWNPAQFATYHQQLASWTDFDSLPAEQLEILSEKQSLSDFCHTRLRKMSGFPVGELHRSYSAELAQDAIARLEQLEEQGLVKKLETFWRLTEKGAMLADQVFLALTF